MMRMGSLDFAVMDMVTRLCRGLECGEMSVTRQVTRTIPIPVE